MKKLTAELCRNVRSILLAIVEDEKRIMDIYCNQWISLESKRAVFNSEAGYEREARLVCS